MRDIRKHLFKDFTSKGYNPVSWGGAESKGSYEILFWIIPIWCRQQYETSRDYTYLFQYFL